jgi:hypothetical protein
MSMLLGAVSSAAAAVDEFFNRVTLLLPGNGTNGAQNNTFLDSSTNNFTITRNGNTTQGTFSPFSQTGWSNFLSGDYLAGSTNLFSTTISTFTIEAWLYPTALNSALGENIIIGDQDPIGATLTLSSYINNSGQVVLGWYDGASKTCVSANTISLNQWSYVAIVVNSNAISMYVNSTTASSLTGTTTLTNRSQTNNFTIGMYASSFRTARWVGYLSNIRVSTVARSISSIPTAPYTSDADTRLLTCQSNRFVDNSSNAFAITPSGTPSVQAFSPFAPTAAYSAATVGGSGYFDGTGDGLVVGNNANLDLTTGDFTVECWFYTTSYGAIRPLVYRFNGNAGSRSDLQYAIALSSGGNLTMAPYQGTTNFDITFTSVPLNQWNHCALVRTGNTVYGFLNGVRNATSQSVTGAINTSTWSTYIGTYVEGGATSTYFGYISGVRVTKGGALYTGSTYTVPTSPFTTTVSAGTAQLLTNFTNAGITDATAKNVLETVGNASISTTQSKFGGSSMFFDGTGDYLTSYNGGDLFRLGTVYTVEMWFYTTTVGAGNAGLINFATTISGNTGFNLYRSSAEIICNDGAAGGTGPSSGASSVSANTWTHLAVVSNGTTTKLYLDGVEKGSYTGTTGSANSMTYVTIGSFNDKSAPFSGYIDDLRVSRFARYTANFTAPTSAFALQ